MYLFQRTVLAYLLSLRASVNLANRTGWTPLHHASLHGHTETCKTLLDAGADVHACNRLGATPIVIAAASGHLSTIK